MPTLQYPVTCVIHYVPCVLSQVSPTFQPTNQLKFAYPSGRAVLRRGSAAAWLLGLRIRILPGTMNFRLLSVLCVVR
jgi:hypothetical protein